MVLHVNPETFEETTLDVRQVSGEAEARSLVAVHADPIVKVGETLPNGLLVTGYFMISEHSGTQVRLPCHNEADFRLHVAVHAERGGKGFFRLWYKVAHPVLTERYARSLGVLDGTVTEYYDPTIRSRFMA